MGKGTKDQKKAPTQEEEIEMEPVYVGKGPLKDPKNAKESGDTSAGIDFSDLDEAYDNVILNLHGIENRRGVAVREVLGNLNEADSPSVADQILKTLAVAALGAASGGITAAIAAKLAQRNDFNTAIQTALDDAAKDAVPKIFDRLAATGSPSSKASFFATQEEAVYAAHEEVGSLVNNKKSSAHKRVHATTGDGPATKADRQAKVFSEELTAARRLEAATKSSKEPARQIQYQASLSAWMTAMAQGSLGQAPHGGTKLEDELDVHPRRHFEKKGENGVIYVSMGGNSKRPVKINHVKVAGITDAARQRIKDVPIRDLKMPIVATGFFYDGSLADETSMWFGDNQMSLGRTETGIVSYYGHSDALKAMMKVARTSSEVEAAQIIIEQDIGQATLADARVRA